MKKNKHICKYLSFYNYLRELSRELKYILRCHCNCFIHLAFVPVCFPCVFCKTAFSTAAFCVRHLRYTHGKDKLTASDLQQIDQWLRDNDAEHYRQIRHRQRQEVDLKQHIRLHTEEKPYKCKLCGATSTNRSDYQKHTRIHTGERPYKCNTCEAAFTQLGHLHEHIRTHTGEKPFKCNTCGASFTLKHHLQKHTRTHTGEKPFKCHTCGSAFIQKSDLQRHMRTHTGEKPFKCQTCGAAFSVSCNLKQHQKKHERVVEEEHSNI